MEVQDTHRVTDLHIEDAETTGLENDNVSTSGSEATIVLGGPEAECHPDDLIHSNQAKLTALMKKKNDLCQWLKAGEGQPAECLDCIEWQLQNLPLVLQPLPSPTPTEPFGEVIHQYTDTLCSKQQQTSLTNSLWQDIAVL